MEDCKLGKEVHIYNPSIPGNETGCSRVQGQPGLYREFEASLGYIETLPPKNKEGEK
jgi:hypothetical protein